MPPKIVQVNRAPVLTLWATVVAEHLGYDHTAALTLGKAVAGLNAQSKGRRLGIFEPPRDEDDKKAAKARPVAELLMITVLGRSVPAVQTPQGLRATIKDQLIEPESVKRYLDRAFGDELGDVQAAMETLARSYPPDQLAAHAYALYEKFRPAIPEGRQGWGAKGELKLDDIRSLAKRAR